MSHGGNGGRCVRLTTLPPTCADGLEILGSSTSWSPQGMSRPVVGLLFTFIFTPRKTCSNAALCTINLTWTDRGLNPCFCGERPPWHCLLFASIVGQSKNCVVESVPRSKHSVSVIKTNQFIIRDSRFSKNFWTRGSDESCLVFVVVVNLCSIYVFFSSNMT